ncbi:MAG: antitoxin [Acidobacteria bacterium]|nr:antitoxin [Acidobacteriota bacterium]
MRTTVTLDPDVETLIRRTMQERGVSFKEALNSAVRAGLDATARRAEREFRQRTFRMGFNPEIPFHKALAVAAALEDAEISHKLSMRK